MKRDIYVYGEKYIMQLKKCSKTMRPGAKDQLPFS